MGRPDVHNPQISDAVDSGGTNDVLAAVSDAIRDLRADVQGLIPRYSTHLNGDPLEVALAHLTLALTRLPDGDR